jgi:two-component sensor histidine kinase/integral membrane sensor domain MASE1
MIWPASAFAGVLIYQTQGWRRWIAILGTFAATLGAKLGYGAEGAMGSISFASVGIVGPVLFALLLERAIPPRDYVFRSESLFALLAASLGASIVSGGIGAFASAFFYDADIIDRWLRWTLGEAVGFGAFAPLMIHLANFGREPISQVRLVEGGIYVVSLVFLTVIVFSIGVIEPVFTFSTATWLSLPLLLLATGRGSRVHGAFGLFAVTVVGVAFLVSRSGIFAQEGMEMRGEVILFQVFVLSALACMSIVGIYERDRLNAEIEKTEKAVLDSVTDFVVSIRPKDGLILFANRRAVELLREAPFDDFLRAGPHGHAYLKNPSLLEVVRAAEREGTTRREKVHSSSIARWFEADLYPSPGSVSVYARDVTEAHQAREEANLVAKEMHHRVQNFFSIASSVVATSARGATTPEEVVIKARGRIAAMSLAYQASKEGGEAGVLDVGILVRKVLAPYMDQERIMIGGPAVTMFVHTSTPFGLILHELATNAVKYGGLSHEGGRLFVGWKREGDRLLLDWTERSVLPVEAPARNGFGTRMMQNAAEQMGGMVTVDWRPDGLFVRIEIPLPETPAEGLAPMDPSASIGAMSERPYLEV